jgi:hypothetical protein
MRKTRKETAPVAGASPIVAPIACHAPMRIHLDPGACAPYLPVRTHQGHQPGCETRFKGCCGDISHQIHGNHMHARNMPSCNFLSQII